MFGFGDLFDSEFPGANTAKEVPVEIKTLTDYLTTLPRWINKCECGCFPIASWCCGTKDLTVDRSYKSARPKVGRISICTLCFFPEYDSIVQRLSERAMVEVAESKLPDFLKEELTEEEAVA